ncbi:MAG: protein translocase subunit SecD [Spirochaetales bacterium]|nr:protein translocase subunit SecD [Spirochaetales bacterium]MCF7938115.1 protein translocase subunit SecD [Spirochaetales bacterium]
MSKRLRLLVIIFFLAISLYFLYPTIRWHILLPEDQKTLALSSREQIREYAQQQAARDLNALRTLATDDAQQPLPDRFGFLAKEAEELYKLEKEDPPETWTVAATLAAFRNQAEAYSALEDHYRSGILGLKDLRDKSLQLGLDLSGGMSVTIETDMESLAERLEREPTSEDREDAVSRAMEILTNRIDRFGVTEPEIRRQGENKILVEIPGAADPERIRSFLMGKGSLNFHIANDEATSRYQAFIKENPEAVTWDNERLREEGIIEAGLVVRGFYKKDDYGIDRLQRYIVIREEVGLDGSHINDAQVTNDPVTGRPVINFFLDKEGGDIFYKLTEANVDKTLAVVMDDKVKAGARIAEPIRDSVRMTGFGLSEAQDLALVLRTAALPVDLNVLNQQSVGASLGEDSIRQGLRAIGFGFALVVLFMFAYYRRTGLTAVLALVLNLYFIISILSVFNLTLTLTSIAGIILTVGMAVDANVIIFERIKEEYRLGKSVPASIKAGFSKALWTILDANITTFIAALFLSQVGKGPIQGFAVTLAVGIISSMFTALFVARFIFDVKTEVFKSSRLRISWRTR